MSKTEYSQLKKVHFWISDAILSLVYDKRFRDPLFQLQTYFQKFKEITYLKVMWLFTKFWNKFLLEKKFFYIKLVIPEVKMVVDELH